MTVLTATLDRPFGHPEQAADYGLVDANAQMAITALSQWALVESSLDSLFERTMRVVVDVLQVAYSGIWRVLSDRQSLRRVVTLPATAGAENLEITVASEPLVQDLLAAESQLLTANKPLVSGIHNFPLPLPPNSQSGLILGIVGRDQLLGCLEIHHDQPRDFSPEDVYFLQAVTNVLASAIERKRSEALIATQSRVLRSIATGQKLDAIFHQLCELLEQDLPGAYCSILVLDRAEKCLRAGAAPSLPAEFARGVDGLLIGECAGSCGTAAYRGEPVFAADIANNPLWAPFRDFALGHGIRACWSSPFFSADGEVLGTFALSHRFACHPTPYHLEAIATAANLASIAAESCRRAQALQMANQQLEQKVQERTSELSSTLVRLRQTQSQLIQAEKMSSLGQMVAGIAHEINNPTAFISGNLHHAETYFQDLVEVLQAYQAEYPHPSPTVIQCLESVDLEFLMGDLPKVLGSLHSGCNRIANIVTGLRNFSRLDESSMKAVDLHEGLENTFMILNHRLMGPGQDPLLRVVKQYGNLPLVSCYANQLNQVFMNLLSNAIDALYERRLNSPEDYIPSLRVETEMAANDRVRILIHDNGSGIDPGVQERIFDPFYTTKPVGQGTGLGLSISYQIVQEQHNGRLYCHSTPTDGTTFTVEIPIAPVVAKLHP
ncbi:MAG: GAF domain-containing protein [Oscillatoriales cyanobacterium]|nr:MAG: GAF domain-containing protein [Oscillatoriales cyanobacterium]